jgi:hypothetical protein
MKGKPQGHRDAEKDVTILEWSPMANDMGWEFGATEEARPLFAFFLTGNSLIPPLCLRVSVVRFLFGV